MRTSEFPRVRAAIIGARGYSGLELARLLLRHPDVELRAALATQDGWALSDFLSEPAAGAVGVYGMDRLDDLLADRLADVYFLATPSEVSMNLAKRILKSGVKVIDLSGAFRLPKATFESTYKFDHLAPELIEEAVFGLSPWQVIPATTRLIANPGCFATSVIMGLIPLLKAGMIQPGSIVIDAKSGTSGAGKKASEALLFSEVDGECLPYRVGDHQHLPEIVQALHKYGGNVTDPVFTTHLIPVRRGILSSIYARVQPGVSLQAVAAAFDAAYTAYPLVRHGPVQKSALLSLRRVVGTARTHLSYALNGDKLFLFSVIDNLLKGAASQAVENLNCMIGRPIATGLESGEGLL